ncbi:MAG TPA: MBL fold metallo-hydrolase [Candidatus Paceibacterota bacterium]|nr:MBL fold metallo-hydrolase [Candidatus Paceibacterota bacterium]
MKLTFYGGAQSVTGSNYLLEAGELKILVDCGMFQGSAAAEEKNYERFPNDPAEVDFVFVTHSHADHTGRLPKLFKEGFRGKIYATPPTLAMTKIALPDNLGLLAREAEKDNHEPLFTEEDLNGVMGLTEGVGYDQPIELGNGVKAVLHDAGHILGSAIIEIQAEGKRLYFSGDLGNPPVPLLKPFEYPLEADYITVESAYGNRVHEDRATRKQILQQVIRETIARKGVLMIPSFAMERTQELLYELDQLAADGEIPRVPMFVDSPLAIRLTSVYQQFPEYFNKEANGIIKSGDDLFKFPGLKYTLTTDESKAINDVPAPKVIIAGSGMSSGGRILHHERRYLSDPNSTLLFVGYQAEGTLGRRLFEGAKRVHIFHEPVEVRCHVKAIGGYSAHADQPMLIKWLDGAGHNLKKVFVVQGETESATALAETITKELGVPALAPTPGQEVEL